MYPDIDLALDFCFTHNPLKYAEDIVGMTVAESEILTLGNSEPLEHLFMCRITIPLCLL